MSYLSVPSSPPARHPGGARWSPPPRGRERRMTTTSEGPVEDALLRLGKHLKRGTVSDDLRQVFLTGGRQGDVFYRDRWSHDKVVRSTHGVNCTGSCSWKVYVKDGIITWETQQTDYPSVGPDSPEYEPRAAAPRRRVLLVHLLPTRVRYPTCAARCSTPTARPAPPRATRCSRGARSRRTPPPPAPTRRRAARAASCAPRGTRRRRSSPRRTCTRSRRTGPTASRVLPDPRHVDGLPRVGARFVQMLGGTMLSFYDWYADLPVASPQVFGDQTDVPESADWWNSTYCIMWGSNVPVTRTPDAHFMTEARYRGQKVVVVSPDYADNTKFADEWLAPHPGTDGALAQAMGHVILTEHYAQRRTPQFAQYAARFTDLPTSSCSRSTTTDRARRTCPEVPHRGGPARRRRAPRRRRRRLGERALQDRRARRGRHPARPAREPRPPLRRGRRRAVEPRPRRHRPAALGRRPARRLLGLPRRLPAATPSPSARCRPTRALPLPTRALPRRTRALPRPTTRTRRSPSGCRGSTSTRPRTTRRARTWAVRASSCVACRRVASAGGSSRRCSTCCSRSTA